jgi:hypothetical protein
MRRRFAARATRALPWPVAGSAAGRQPPRCRARDLAAGWALVLVLGAAIGGCGYSFSGHLPPHIKTIAVPIFVNRTTQPFVEGTVTAAVIRAFAQSGKLEVVSASHADALLEGEVVGYDVLAIAFDSRTAATEYRLIVTVNLDFKDVRRGELLWSERGLQEQADFRVLGPTILLISAEEAAVVEAAQDIGRKIVSLALDRF